jgi:hypothetical protein
MFMASRFLTNCLTFSHGVFSYAAGNFGNKMDLENPISFIMYTGKKILFEGMHFGMGHIRPYSIRWNGDTFKALTWEGKTIVGNLNFTSNSLPHRIVYNIEEDHRDYIHTFTFNDIISSPGMPTDAEVSIAFGGRLKSATVDRNYHYYKYTPSKHPLKYDKYSLKPFAKLQRTIRYYTNNALFADYGNGLEPVVSLLDRQTKPAYFLTIVVFFLPIMVVLLIIKYTRQKRRLK